MPEFDESSDPSKAEALFAEYLALVQGGGDASFDSWCRDHPGHADELRRIHDEWVEADGALETARRSVLAAVRARFGDDVDPGVSLESDDEGKDGDGSGAVIERLKEHRAQSGRYRLKGEIGRGGMGAILRVWDEDLRRHLAMKVILGRESSPAVGNTPAVPPEILSRFLEEAQITGQLDHPGIVPVHELGLDATGRVYFTMKLVKGRNFEQVIEDVHGESEDWTLTRAVGALQKACEAIAFSHSKQVIHRDLKPSNLMVGRFGEVYVMDWGLAKVLGREDSKDIRIKRETLDSLSLVETDRRQDDDSPLLTMDGQVLGTPAYMSPEQARGELERMGPASDVYSMGAILYHLLANQMPYVPTGARVSPVMVLRFVLEGDPKPLREIDPNLPPELVAICEKAMSREIAERYEDVEELAADLRAYLEGRVVRAHATGPVVKLRKWLGRNQAAAAILVAAMVGLSMLLGYSLFQAKQKAALEESEQRARASEQRAIREEYLANISTASLNLLLGSRKPAVDALDRCPDSEKDIEWYQLKWRTDHSFMVLRGHEGWVRAVAYSLSGRYLYSGGQDGKLFRWDLFSGEIVAEVVAEPDSQVLRIAVSRDGKLVATGAPSGRIRLWDAETLEPAGSLAGHTDWINSLEFSRDSMHLLSAARDDTVRVWSVQGRTETHSFECKDPRAAFRPEGKRVILVPKDSESVLSWDLESNRSDTLIGSLTTSVECLDSRWSGLLLGSADRLEYWKLEPVKQVWIREAPNSQVTSVVTHAWLDAYGTRDGVVRLVSRSGPGKTFVGHEDSILSIAISPQAITMASGSMDSTVRVWRTSRRDDTDDLPVAGVVPIAGIEGDGGFEAVAVSSDGSKVVIGGGPYHDLELSALPFGRPLRLFDCSGSVGAAAFDPSRASRLALSVGQTLWLWDTDADFPVPLGSLSSEEDRGIRSLVFNSDGSRLTALDRNGELTSWDTASRAFRARSGARIKGATMLALARDDRHIAVGTDVGKILAFDAETLETIGEADAHSTPRYHRLLPVTGLEFGPDGTLWSTNLGGELLGHRVGTEVRQIRSLKIAKTLAAFAISESGKRGLVVSNGVPGVIDLASGRRIFSLSEDYRPLFSSYGSVSILPVPGRHAFLTFQPQSVLLWPTTHLGSGLRERFERSYFFAEANDYLSRLEESTETPEAMIDAVESDSELEESLRTSMVQHERARFGEVREDLLDALYRDRSPTDSFRRRLIEAIRLDPPNLEALLSRSRSLAEDDESSPEELEESYRLARAAAAATPLSSGSLRTLGLACYRTGRLAEARERLRAVEALHLGIHEECEYLEELRDLMGKVEAAAGEEREPR